MALHDQIEHLMSFNYQDFQTLQEESCASKAMIAGKEFFEKQQTQLMQLVQLLRQVENQVNSHQDDILQSLATQRDSLKKLFQKSIYFMSSFHTQNNDTFLITVKLLQLIFYKTDAVLCSAEDGMQGLIEDLAEKMCSPMMEYVKGLKAELKMGTCAHLLAAVDEMERTMRSGRIELEEARKRARVAEEGRIDALCKLKESEEKVRRMKEYYDHLAEIQKERIEHLVSQKVHYSRPCGSIFLFDVTMLRRNFLSKYSVASMNPTFCSLERSISIA